MNNSFTQNLFLIFILLIPIYAQSQTLWGETSLGMYPSQVVKIVKGSRLIKDGGNLGSGAKELVGIDDFRLVNSSFNVRLYFIDDKLTQVTLKPNVEEDISSALRMFDSLTNALRSKYGKEISRNIKTGMTEAIWVNGRTNIQLTVWVFDSINTARLFLIYNSSLSEEAEKL